VAHPARSLPLAPFSSRPCAGSVRPHLSALCNGAESLLPPIRFEPASWICLHPRTFPLGRHASLSSMPQFTEDSTPRSGLTEPHTLPQAGGLDWRARHVL